MYRLEKKQNGDPMIRVRRMLRPEDTNIKNPNQCDLNLVFYTERENIISAERIEGILEINYLLLSTLFLNRGYII